MPTSHPRISVTNDPELADALARAEAAFAGAGKATIVHDLAIMGAEALDRDQRERTDAVERLIACSTRPGEVIDVEVLEQVDALGWTQARG